ncbi:MAG TPA: ornithine cyclodeaminase family protein [Mesorhizobium sp.]|jgi:ornithine cyclodeaminase|uniref:iminosuccinate reductase BhcD n=1 Tax=Mesorhizobium sp. TaxID=1871066 RepID=UPI002DDD05B9|nr:iminosuccinate reductase BhcD [Mesorhizobium sp.]HEV2501821.1 ornithine cyclodeaminase family protein [Mesorhizobium sp.]
MIIVPEALIPGLVTQAECMAAVESAFASMASGTAQNFPVVREAIGHVDALYGFKSGFDRKNLTLGVKSGGFWPGNQKYGLANHQSTIMLFDADTGICRAIVGGNLITALRTAAASAVAIKYLARQDARVIGMVGAGHQSTFQLKAALAQRHFERVVAWNYHPEMLTRLETVAREHEVPFDAVSLDQLGQQADVIITVTSSFQPLLKAGQIRPGTHLSCMGTDTKGKQEIEAELLAKATVFTDEVAQAISIGESQHAVAAGLLNADRLIQIGAVIEGSHPGRTANGEITLFDGTGIALQDLAVASLAVEMAVQKGIATEIA